MTNGMAIAASIVAGDSTAVLLLVYGTACSDPGLMNLCWILALALLYAPIVIAMREARSAR